MNLKENPERLVSLISTPENIDTIKAWLKNSDIKADENIVVDYDRAIQLIANQLDSYKDNDMDKK